MCRLSAARIRLQRNSDRLDFDDVERVSIHPLRGSDQVTIHDLAGTDVSEVTADLARNLRRQR